jgi:hypothetical protein
MSSERFVVSVLDESDPEAVYEWTLGSCRDAPMEALALEVGAEPDAESILMRLPLTFPPETRDAAHRGCEEGLKLRGVLNIEGS